MAAVAGWLPRVAETERERERDPETDETMKETLKLQGFIPACELAAVQIATSSESQQVMAGAAY